MSDLNSPIMHQHVDFHAIWRHWLNPQHLQAGCNVLILTILHGKRASDRKILRKSDAPFRQYLRASIHGIPEHSSIREKKLPPERQIEGITISQCTLRNIKTNTPTREDSLLITSVDNHGNVHSASQPLVDEDYPRFILPSQGG